MVSDELKLEDLFTALRAAEGRLGRRVKPALYTVEDGERDRMIDGHRAACVVASLRWTSRRDAVGAEG